MKKTPEFRIVGKISKEKEEELKNLFKNRFLNHYLFLTPEQKKFLEKYELSKTKEEIKIIELVNKATSKFMKNLGVKPIDVSSQNIHLIEVKNIGYFVPPTSEKYKRDLEENYKNYINQKLKEIEEGFKQGFLSEELYREVKKKYEEKKEKKYEEIWVEKNKDLLAGYTDPYNQWIILLAEIARVQKREGGFYLIPFMNLVLHEILHFKSYAAFSVDQELKPWSYRRGVRVFPPATSPKIEAYFLGLDEAITAEIGKRLFNQLIENKIFTEEIRWLRSEKAKLLIKDLSIIFNFPEDEIFWINENYEFNFDLENSNNIRIFEFYHQRKVLNYLCEEIQKEFSDQYPNKEAVFNEFFKAYFNGKLLTIARLVEKTFGEGSFRLLGQMKTVLISEVKNIFEKLQNLRNKRKESQK